MTCYKQPTVDDARTRHYSPRNRVGTHRFAASDVLA